jgi:hypothetical protein
MQCVYVLAARSAAAREARRATTCHSPAYNRVVESIGDEMRNHDDERANITPEFECGQLLGKERRRLVLAARKQTFSH